MKFFVLSLTALLGIIGAFKTKKFDHLDFNSEKFDISWDDIADDLWP